MIGQSKIDALVAGGSYRWNFGSPVGTAATVTYSFVNSVPGYYGASGEQHLFFQPFSLEQKAAARAILSEISNVANLTFVEKTDGSGQITFGNHLQDINQGGYAYYPSIIHGVGGDVWVNSLLPLVLPAVKGNYAYHVIAHKIGHALGLKHPFDGFPTLSAAEDHPDYTIMSYTPSAEPYTGAPSLYDIAALQYLYGANMASRTGNDTYTVGGPYSIWDAGGFDTLVGTVNADFIDLREGTFSARTSIAYGTKIEAAAGGANGDVIIGNALDNVLSGEGGGDQLYGLAGDDTLVGGTGNDTFFAGPGPGNDTYNGGPDTDTIDYGGTTQAIVVNLAAGTASSAEIGTDTIVNIENVIGGPGVDMITGNAAPNSLEGGGGGDTIDGGAGADAVAYTRSGAAVRVNLTAMSATGGDAQGDTLLNIEHATGSAHHDWLIGSAIGNTLRGLGGWDRIFGGDGNDRLFGGSGNDVLVGGAGNEHAQGDAGADYVYGGDGVDILYGGAGNDVLLGQAGPDTLYGGPGFDYLFGGTEIDVLIGNGDTDVLYGEGGVDWMYGGPGVDWLLGGDADDKMYGEADPDLLFGESGNDWLDGGAGNDWYWGGPGADRFVSAGIWGHDVIFDYQDGIDRIDFSGAGSVAGMADLSIVDSGGYAVISDGTSALYLAGIGAYQISSADFLF